MASPILNSFLSVAINKNPSIHEFSHSFTQKKKPHILSFRKSTTFILSSLQDQQKDENHNFPANSTIIITHHEEQKQETNSTDQSKHSELQNSESKDKQQEVDWKQDKEFKKFMGNPSIEAAMELEKKRIYQQLKEIERETNSTNPIKRLWNNVVRDRLQGEKEMLEKANETFKALDLNKLKSCFGFDTFFATDVRRFGDGGIFVGNLRKPIEEIMPKLEKKLSEAAGRDVVLWFMEERNDDITKQVCMVQPKAEIDLQLEFTKLSTPLGYISALALAVTTFGTIAFMSGFFLKPGANFDDYISDVIPLFAGFLSILAVSEVATRVTAARYGVKLSPSFLVPSNWTGCLGVMNNYESLLPNKKALFDIPFARTASAYLASLILALSAFIVDRSFNGGDNALFIRPEFFYNNPLLSFVQLVIGPYADDLGNVLPNAVEGVGVPVDPLAFAGLLGMVVTSLNLLPIGRLEGGRIAQALFGRNTATILSSLTCLLLGLGGLNGSILCIVWGLFATFFRGGEEIPARDEISPLESERYAWGFVLAVTCFLTLFPNGGGTFSSYSLLDPPFFRGGI